MNIFSLSIRCLARKKVRTILLFCIVFLASGFIYAGWSCRSASVQTQTEGKRAIGASFRLEENEANRHVRSSEALKKIGDNANGSADGTHVEQLESGDWMIWHDNSFETLQMDDILTLASQDGIAEYNITTVNTVVNAVNFMRIEDPDVEQSDGNWVSLRGNLEMRLDMDVQSGNIEVREGRMIAEDDKDVCVISRELADLNGLKLGDTLGFNERSEAETATVCQAEIIGIYETIYKMTPVMYGDSYRSENVIFTDLRFPEKAEGHKDDHLYQYATFWVDNVDEYDTIKEQMKQADIDWNRYDFLDNTGMSDTVASNFGDLETMSTIILVLVICSSVVILFLVCLFWLGSRVHEIGVFLAMGKRKSMIVMQMLLEGVLVGSIAFLLATFCAPAISENVADYLVGYELEQQETEKNAEQGVKLYLEDDTEVVGVQVAVTGEVILLSVCSVLGIIVAAVLFSCVSVAVKKPQEILSRMS
jgi:putative ABC transport system permease protein